MAEKELRFQIAQKMEQVFEGPARYRGAHGGRGSSKSWGFARRALQRMVIAQLAGTKCRILCARELQNSIKDSVLQLLIDQIEVLGIQDFFDYGESYLRGVDGRSDFLFKGLRHNIKEIKSTEAIDITWIEEAETLSEETFRVLPATVFRVDDSEIWLSWNPELKDAPIQQRFIDTCPADAKIVEVNYTDNPWFPAGLELERLDDLKRDPDLYAHIWGGCCITRTDAQVLGGKWRVDTFTRPEELDGGPYYGCDWGFSADPIALVICWVKGNTLYIEYEAGGKRVEIKDTPALFDTLHGIKTHVIRADNARPEMISHMQTEGYKVIGADKWPGSIEDGITHLRSYDEIVIHERCVNVEREARLWSYKVDRQTGDVLPVLLDANNHCFVGDTLVATNKGQVRISDIKTGDMVLTRFGLREVTKTFDNGLKEVRKFTFPNGKSLTGTDTHEIITIDGKKYLKDITQRDTLFFLRGDTCRSFKAKKTKRSFLTEYLIDVIRQAKEEVTGFILRAQGARLPGAKRNIFTLLFGRKKTGLFLKGLRSITRTTIRSITISPIWCSGLHFYTGLSIVKDTTAITKGSRQIISTGSGTLPQSGMVARQVGSGTGTTPGRSSRIFSLRMPSVSNAVRFTREIFQLVLQSFVQTPVGLPIAGSQGLTTRSGFARPVARVLSVVNTQERKHAQGFAGNRQERVYDISVDDQHEYFANGILVSNCMDALRYALAPAIRKVKNTGKAIYAGQFSQAMHVSLEELWPVKGLPLTIGMSLTTSGDPYAVIGQVNRVGQLRIIEQVPGETMGVNQFAKSVLRPILSSKYRGLAYKIVSFRDRSSSRTIDTEERLLIDELETAGFTVESVNSDLLGRRLEAVRWFLGQLTTGRPAIIVSPTCDLVSDGFLGGYQFKRMIQQDGDEQRYTPDPDKNKYVTPHECLQYICMAVRGDMEERDSNEIMVGKRNY
ncbi:MAG: PBSX family phage terminase large subunit [Chlorobium sp.]|nr:PBSX family phage terminase large subunit [Chlorobium sp.]